MKKIYAMMLAAACAICLAGCTREILVSDEAIVPEEEIIICGTMGDLSADGTQATRTVVRNTSEVWWRNSDVIAVFMSTSTTKNRFKSTLSDGEIAKTSYFSGTISQTGSKYYVAYPYGTSSYSTSSGGSLTLEVLPNQPVTAATGSFNTGMLPSYGSFTSSSTDFTMKAAAGGIKFSLSRDDINKVTFEGNNGEKVAAKVIVSNLSTTPSISRASDGYTSVALIPSSGNLVAGADYFIVITPGSLSKGFTITLTTEGGESLVVRSTKSRTIKAGVFGTFSKALDEYAERAPEAVDLGLPSGTKWAPCNVGATKPEESGDYFAWGETEAKSDYSWSTYKYCNGSNTTFTKYNFRSDYGTVDNKGLLDLDDDAAHAALGGDWRMPTLSEAKELLDTENCTWEWTENYNSSGVKGYKVTSKKNGNFIFLPQAGCQWGSAVVNEFCTYWVSSNNLFMAAYAKTLYSNGSSCSVGESERFSGFPVRPVYGKLVQVEGLGVPGSLTIEKEQTVDFPVTVSPSDASDQTITLSIADTHIVTYSGSQIMGVNPGSTTVTAYASNGVSASCVVTVSAVPEYVDLGLSVKWATFNLGAETPDGYGNYYAWGETATKSSYDWSNYLLGGSSSTISKYNLLSANGTVDHKRTLDFDDDAANVAWGGDWRLPTLDEFNELKNTSNCTWTWTTQNGKKGYRVTSKKTGYEDRSIFLPAAGSYDGSSLTGTELYALYWTSTPYPTDYSKSYDLSAQQSSIGFNTPGRYRGLPVRPVYGSFVPATGVTVDESVSVEEGATVTITPTVTPSNASNKSLEVISSDSSVATYNGSVVKGVAPGTATLTFYTHNGISATCKVTVKELKYVDLGLPSGTKWAKWNLGASKPEGYGGFYAWGETQQKSVHSWETYVFWVSGDTSDNVKINKYCPSDKTGYWDGSGSPDNKTVLDLDDDAARVKWGGNWRIPTDAEWTELMDNCTWTWTDDYNGSGIKGQIVTSANGNSIFLPSSGICYANTLNGRPSVGFYWSSSLNTDIPSKAKGVCFGSTVVRWRSDDYECSRCHGFSVRPVMK